MSRARALARRVVIDTSAYSHLRRGDPRVIEWLAAAPLVLVPVTALGELEAGFRRGTRYAENVRVLRQFLSDPLVRIVPTDEEVALCYGRLFADLRDRGTPIPTNDIWIAAATLVSGAELLTFDRDFEHVPGLRLTVLDVAR